MPKVRCAVTWPEGKNRVVSRQVFCREAKCSKHDVGSSFLEIARPRWKRVLCGSRSLSLTQQSRKFKLIRGLARGGCPSSALSQECAGS